MKQLKDRIKLLVDKGEINDTKEKEKLEHLLVTKKWNPYCIRHSAITSDSDYLPEYALKKKVRWSMNSKQGSRYMRHGHNSISLIFILLPSHLTKSQAYILLILD
jgi:integrase/recombinase XerD